MSQLRLCRIKMVNFNILKLKKTFKISYLFDSGDLNMVSPCDDDPQPGIKSLCRAAFPTFYYDKLRNKCFGFIYGGCHATRNLFGSLEDCESECVNKI